MPEAAQIGNRSAAADACFTFPDTLLTYHELTRSFCADQYALQCTQFDQHLALVSTLIDAGKLRHDAACISFDDGHRSNFELASAGLARHQLKAIFFITAGWVGEKSSTMGWKQLAALAKMRHSIQSHGWSHKFLSHCSVSELDRELKASKHALEDRLGVAVQSISAPGGRWNRHVIQACQSAGYEHLYTSDPLPEPIPKYGILLHGRMMVRRSSRPQDISKFLIGDGWFWFRLRMRHQLKQSGKRILGEARYHALWHAMTRRQSHDTEAVTESMV
ncbi:MAG TPA: polysaccharide deacetylase family protein [Terriglobales bacterium]|nr:polysaccharide deacetylase family protein [Terriglobales bacterium]